MDDALLGLLLSPADWTFHPFIDRVDCSQCCPHLSHPSRCGGRREVGGNRPHQNLPLPAVGHLLPPLVVRPSPSQLHTAQLSPRDPPSAIRLSALRRPPRPSCPTCHSKHSRLRRHYA